MMNQMTIKEEYFSWMSDLVCGARFSEETSFDMLLRHLHTREFVPAHPKDKSRAKDGADLRYRFALYHNLLDIKSYLDGPCSILEMMIALAIKCEEETMSDPRFGDRTGQWFWDMIKSLDLKTMTDGRYDSRYVDYVIDRFLNLGYDSNGRGGLFTIRNYPDDIRDLEIWYQLCEYLNRIV